MANDLMESQPEPPQGPSVESALQAITVADGEMQVSSREIAVRFDKAHKNVLQTIQNLDGTVEFARLNFQPTSYLDSQGKEQREILMTREGCIRLVLKMSGPKAALWAEAFINAFKEMEKRLRDAPPDLTNPVVLRGYLLDTTERLIAAEQEKAEALELVEQLEPAKDALDRLEAAEGSLSISDAAKALGVGLRYLTRLLLAEKWVFRRVGSGPLLGYANKERAGWVEHHTYTYTDPLGNETYRVQMRITGKGLSQLAQMISYHQRNMHLN